jgi:flagellar capping protein FliD
MSLLDRLFKRKTTETDSALHSLNRQLEEQEQRRKEAYERLSNLMDTTINKRRAGSGQ